MEVWISKSKQCQGPCSETDFPDFSQLNGVFSGMYCMISSHFTIYKPFPETFLKKIFGVLLGGIYDDTVTLCHLIFFLKRTNY